MLLDNQMLRPQTVSVRNNLGFHFHFNTNAINRSLLEWEETDSLLLARCLDFSYCDKDILLL